MERKIFLILLVIMISFQIVSSIQIEAKKDFSPGENFIAKLSGNFYTPVTKSNIYFYRGQSGTSFGIYSLLKIEGNYYISFGIPTEKIPGNYSLQLKGIKDYSGNELVEDNVTKYFKISNEQAKISISPALSTPKNYFYNLSLVNLDSKPINVTYSLEGTTEKKINLKKGERKDVTLKTFGGNKFENILFKVGNKNYSALVYSKLKEIPVENKTIKPNQTLNKSENFKNKTDNKETLWDILFGSNKGKNQTAKNNTFQKNETKNNSSPLENNIRTCKELNLPSCSDNEMCDGNLVDGKETQCCNRTCVKKEDSGSTLKTIGWILIGVAALFLIWFFKFKFSKKKRTSSKLIK